MKSRACWKACWLMSSMTTILVMSLVLAARGLPASAAPQEMPAPGDGLAVAETRVEGLDSDRGGSLVFECGHTDLAIMKPSDIDCQSGWVIYRIVVEVDESCDPDAEPIALVDFGGVGGEGNTGTMLMPGAGGDPNRAELVTECMPIQDRVVVIPISDPNPRISIQAICCVDPSCGGISGPAGCYLACPNGYALGPDGCPICECLP